MSFPPSSPQEIMMAQARRILGVAVTDEEVLSKLAFALLVAETETAAQLALKDKEIALKETAVQLALKDTEIALKGAEAAVQLALKETAVQLARKDTEIALKDTEIALKGAEAAAQLARKDAEVAAQLALNDKAMYKMRLASLTQRYAFRSLATSSLVFFSPLLKSFY